ncbi:hypothetical protein FQA39_LY13682 [Lamprigera yunnana]|nr:hypothetical protein FQA39_LY13682 [Lamprigera yunnana]
MEFYLIGLYYIVGLYCVRAQSTSQHQNFHQAVKTCLEKSKLTFKDHDSYVKAFMDGGEQMHNFSECVLRTMGHLDSKGEILYEEVKKISVPDRSPRDFSNAINECKKKSKLTFKDHDSYVKAFMDGGEQMHNFSECVLRTMGHIDSKGEILYEEIKKISVPGRSPSDFSSAVNECRNERGNSTAETSYKFLKCVFTNTAGGKFHQAVKMCLEKSKLTFKDHDSYVKAFMDGGEQMHNFSECVLRTMGHLDSKGEILYEEVKKISVPDRSPRDFSNAINECKSERGNSTAETSYKFLKCVFTNTAGGKFHQAVKMCLEKSKLTFKDHDSYVKAFMDGGEQMHNFSECVLRTMGHIDSKGEILYEEVKKISVPDRSPSDFSNAINECKSERGTSTAETSYKFLKCVFTNTAGGKFHQAVKICLEKSKLIFKDHDSYVKAFMDGGEQMHTFSECVLRTMGHIDSKGEILYEEVKKLSVPGRSPCDFSSAVNECRNERGNSTAETSYKFLKCVFINAAGGNSQQQKFHQAVKMCLEKSKLTFKDHDCFIKAFIDGGEEMQNFSECVLRSMGYIDTKGGILYEEIKKIVVPGLSRSNFCQIVDQCKNEKGNGTAETSYKFFKCVFSKITETLRRGKHQYQKYQDALKVCGERTNLTVQTYDSYVKALADGGEQIQKFSECLFREMGYIDTNGEILYEEIKKIVVPGLSRSNFCQIVDQCKSERGTSTAETSYKFSKCVFNNIMKIYNQYKIQKEKFEQALKVCSDKYGLTVQSFDAYSATLAAGGEKIQLFSKCVLQEIGYLDGNGNILYDEVKKTPPPGISLDEYSSVIERCKSEKGNSTVETSYKFSHCLFSNVKKLYGEQKFFK